MDSTSSVSKGVFVFEEDHHFDLDFESETLKELDIPKIPLTNKSDLWYQAYLKNWNDLQNAINKQTTNSFSSIPTELLSFVKHCSSNEVIGIPTAALLMGINMPDHLEQFSTLSGRIKADITPHVAVLYAEECSTIKHLVENMVAQFVNNPELEADTMKIRKINCTFSFLKSWYESYSETVIARNYLVVILPEFEGFDEAVLQDFILIVSSYAETLPIVLIFGIATTLAAIHDSFPYQVSSKLNIQVFNFQSSNNQLNNVLNNVILTDTHPFQFGGKVFRLMLDTFLFYDFSVTGFIQNMKFAMLEHFSYGNAMALCTTKNEFNRVLSRFKHGDFENVRRLMSFRAFVESKDYESRIKLIEEDDYFRLELKQALIDFEDYYHCFYALLKVLFVLVADLPGAPLGKQFRELYTIAVTENLTQTAEYKQCMMLLRFISETELRNKFTKISNLISKSLTEYEMLNELKTDVFKCIWEMSKPVEKAEDPSTSKNSLPEIRSRLKLKEVLSDLVKEKDAEGSCGKNCEKYLEILMEYFKKGLVLPSTKPFHEIFFFNNASSIKNHVLSSHRVAIHTALINPQSYLQCDCCQLSNEQSILPTMPDLSIVYKLHLECGKYINMYDWLQAFVAIVDPSSASATESEEELEKNIDPKIQARFAQAVAEMEFLGFIKSSKRKADHVQRLTWGGC